MLAAIEVYNKPDFLYREEVFSILVVNSWELLLKARILQIDRNRLAAIFEYERRQRVDGTLSNMLYRKQNRAGNQITVGLFKAYDRLVNDYKDTLDLAIRKNLEALVEVRDNAVHFFNKDFSLTKRIYEIGIATLKNYIAVVRQWFAVDLSQYRIFLMPLAFLPNIHKAEAVTPNSEERRFIKYLDNLRGESSDDMTRDFNVALTIEVQVKRSKSSDASPVIVSKEPDAIPITLEEEDLRERYPWNYGILTSRLKKRYSDFKANQKYHEIRKQFELDANYCRERLLDPGNPKSMKKKFYNPNILRAFDEHYERSKSETTTSAELL